MEWLERMTAALAYMEAHLTEEFDIARIAREAASSTFHFQRLFHMLTGVTIAEYVRKRRLTLAAQELAAGKARVLDVALKYGYDTPESFAKAFRKLHGISPSAAREPGAALKACPRISFHLSIKGDQEMDYKIVERGSFQVVGKARTIGTEDGVNLKQIPAFWDDAMRDGLEQRLAPYDKTGNYLGICMDMECKKEQFTYMIAVESDRAAEGGELIAREIPAANWAVFTSIGPMPGAIQEVWKRIFREWFPATGYEHAPGPELEVYYPGNSQAADYRCEVWIPVIKK